MARRRPFDPNDSSRPSLFTADEWAEIVRELKFSPGQAQVVGRVMQSQGYTEIALALNISESTVRKHFKHARERLTTKTKLLAGDQVAVVCGVFWTFRQVIERKGRICSDAQAVGDKSVAKRRTKVRRPSRDLISIPSASEC